MTQYALIPVRVKISCNSASEIDRAQKIVSDVVEFYQDMCVNAWKEGTTEEKPTTPEGLTYWVEQRKPEDPIEVITE